jgi:hypothetical protein
MQTNSKFVLLGEGEESYEGPSLSLKSASQEIPQSSQLTECVEQGYGFAAICR